MSSSCSPIIPRTYIISGANGLYTRALELLLESQLQSKSLYFGTSERIGLMYQVQTGLAYDKRAYNVKSWIKSLLGESKDIITNKGSLYLAMKEIQASQYLSPTQSLDNVQSVKPGEILIVKPIGNRTGGGRDNQILKSTDDLIRVKNNYRRKKLRGIVSKYINDPWLHNGRKFHLRLYFLVRAGTPEVPYFSELWSEGKIITAEEPYIQDFYDRTEIHDTHMKSTPEDYTYPDDLQIPIEMDRDIALESIRDQLNKIGQSLGRIMSSRAESLPESYYGFEIFGLDLMIQTQSNKPQVLLLEANTRVAYGPVGGQKNKILTETGRQFDPENGPWTPEYISFSKRYFEWMILRGVEPFYNICDNKSKLSNTFRISGGTGLLHIYLKQLLVQNGFQIATGSDYTGYLHMEKLCDDLKSYDKSVENIPCDIKSILSAQKRVIANKELLHFHFFQTFPKIAKEHLALTWNLKNVPQNKIREILILRPVGVGASCGAGIEISTNPFEFESKSKKVLSQTRALQIKSVIASEYITNPLLTTDGRKFHVRMFFLVRVGPDWPESFTFDLWTRGRIVTAALPYQRGDWHNKKIHDTHAESTDFNQWFPEDLPDPTYHRIIFNQMKTICEAAAIIMQNEKVGPYPESRNAFEIFGCDFMITDDYRVILIEINDRVGYANLSERIGLGMYTFDDFSYDYFSWLFKNVIGPLFLPEKDWIGLRLPFFGQEFPKYQSS